MFIGREPELKSLNNLYKSDKFEFAVIYGRRRVGKTALINVFVGDMSLVGPRPEVRHYVDYWTPEQMHVLDVRPGITDPASIKFRNENELMGQAEDPENYYINVIMQEKIKLYLEYVENAGFWYDLKLIFKTFKVIVKE